MFYLQSLAAALEVLARDVVFKCCSPVISSIFILTSLLLSSPAAHYLYILIGISVPRSLTLPPVKHASKPILNVLLLQTALLNP